MEEGEDQRVGMKLRLNWSALMSVESNVMLNLLKGLHFFMK